LPKNITDKLAQPPLILTPHKLFFSYTCTTYLPQIYQKAREANDNKALQKVQEADDHPERGESHHLPPSFHII
jgi:hypothetical protein